MADQTELERLYREAQAALKAKEYDRAVGLLTQILVIDEDYKDTSRLLARVVREKRRRWYNDVRIWGTVFGAVVIGLLIWIVPKLSLRTTPAVEMVNPTGTAISTNAVTPTITPSPMPTPIPLTWKRINIGQEFPRDTITGIVIDSKDPDVIYVNTQNAGFFTSITGSVSWRPISRMEINYNILSQLNAHIFSTLDDHPISNIDPDGKKWFYDICKGYSVWCVSTDGGKTWRRFSEAGEFFSSAITLDNNGMVYLVCGQNICKFTADTAQLTILGKPQVGFVTLIQISPHDPNTIYVAGDGLVVSKDGGNTWTKINNGLGAYFPQLEAGTGDSSILYLLSGECKEGGGRGGVRQLLYGSRDGGFTWRFLTQEGCYLAKDVDGKTLYRHGVPENTEPGPYTRGWILRSADNGSTWQEIATIPSGIHTLIAHPEQSGLLYAYDNQEPSHRFVSTDYGISWEDNALLAVRPCYGVTNHLLDDYKPISIDPQNSNHALFVENNELWETHDGCSTSDVTQIDLGFKAVISSFKAVISSIAIDAINPNTFYVGTDIGAYISFDGGQTWGQVNDGLLGATVVYSIAVDKESNVYAATPYGVFKLESK
jgi:photosystem II stability/assembly factor-like uncharacterized protein